MTGLENMSGMKEPWIGLHAVSVCPRGGPTTRHVAECYEEVPIGTGYGPALGLLRACISECTAMYSVHVSIIGRVHIGRDELRTTTDY